ncbi:WAS/WASL-interacting protein family member 1-like [Cervus elaphus]|uniref:WAS/WASL-interacting protein family member 1-like n=1 Tax=Cervus elaphus TaxID=9860 RepID=UPI001CC2F8F7|nr:WAS/WASL-interacting protein family member 1-like [Cervus elaphus]
MLEFSAPTVLPVPRPPFSLAGVLSCGVEARRGTWGTDWDKPGPPLSWPGGPVMAARRQLSASRARRMKRSRGSGLPRPPPRLRPARLAPRERRITWIPPPATWIRPDLRLSLALRRPPGKPAAGASGAGSQAPARAARAPSQRPPAPGPRAGPARRPPRPLRASPRRPRPPPTRGEATAPAARSGCRTGTSPPAARSPSPPAPGLP